MKNNPFINSFTTLLSIILLTGCGREVQPTAPPTFTSEPTETLPATTTIKPTATFLPTFTPAPFFYTPFPTQTLTPVPKDIFDNFQGLSGNCRTASGLDSLMVVRYINDEVLIMSLAGVSISFDKDSYFSGDSIKLSVNADDSHNKSKLMNDIVVKVIVEEPVKLKRYSFYLYDTGTHGDEKADDGLYTNTFDKTLNTGIYKFYFQIFGRDKNTGEKIVKECFLAKTISPTQTEVISQGSENKLCNKIVASDPIVVRQEGVGGNDSTEYGWWAYYPKAVSLGETILAIWQVGSDGQKPKPHVYLRLLDSNVNPIGEVKLLFERKIIGTTTLIRQENKAVFSYCGRYNIQDRSTSAFLDSQGNLISEIVRSPTNIVCGEGPVAVWNGSHMLFYSWSIGFGESFGRYLDVADVNGNSMSWRKVPPISSSPVLRHDGSMLMATISWDNSLAIHRFDLEGNDLEGWAILKAITYEVDGKTVVGNFRSTYIVPNIDSWMVVAALSAPGIYIARLTPDGSLISTPVIVEKNLYFENGFDDVIAYQGGVAILGSSTPFGYLTKTGIGVLFISENGTVTQQWYTKEDERPLDGSFFEHQGRLFLIYTSKPTYEKPITNQVLIRELECIP